MKYSFLTRLIHFRHHWAKLLVWLLFPVIVSWIIVTGFSQIQSQSQIPVGIVLEEETPLTLELYEKIRKEPLIQSSLLSEPDARLRLLKHDLDSVFIIHTGYDSHIKEGDRKELITGLKSNFSFAYTSTSEIIMSFVQEHTVRLKATRAVNDLIQEHDSSLNPSTANIIDKSKDIQNNQDFLTTSFVFNEQNSVETNDASLLIKPWNVWAITTLLTTFFIFDWVINEKRISLRPRFLLARISFKKYLLHNLLFYTFLLYIFDIITFIFFKYYFNFNLSLHVLSIIFSYRILLNISAFLLAQCFKKTYFFHTITFIIVLIITLMSGAIFPIYHLVENYPWLTWLNPLHGFLQRQIFNGWLITVIILLIGWILRKER